MKSCSLFSFCLVFIAVLVFPASSLGSSPDQTQLDYASIKLKVMRGVALEPAEQKYWEGIHGKEIKSTFVQPAPRRDDRGGPDDFGYRWVDSDEEGGPEFEWIDISDFDDVINIQNVSDDSNHGSYELGFDFPYYDNEFDEIRYCSNGWASFTSGDNHYNWEDFRLPNNELPENMLAVCLTDWNPNNGGGAYMFWTDENMAVLTWENIPHFDNGNLRWTFQIILTPNGMIKYQYAMIEQLQRVTTIGIQNDDRDDGLTIYQGNGNDLEEEYAIRISAAMGWLTGLVTDLETEGSIEGATITLNDGNQAETDGDGVYWFNEIQADPYTATASAYGYNPVASEEFEIADEETTEVNFILPHPEIRLDVPGYIVELNQQEVLEEEFNIFNEGNGELEFDSYFTIPHEERRDPVGDIHFDLPVSEITAETSFRGLTTDGSYLYLSGSNNMDNPNYIYVFDREGEYVRQFEQPIEDPSSIGMRGLACDGNYLYGSDGPTITQFNINGEAVAEIPSPYNPSRYINYDPETDHFWISERVGDITEIDREGNVLTEFDIDDRIYGMAWHPADLDGFNLYIINRLADNEEFQHAIFKVNPEDGEVRHVMDLNTGAGDQAIALEITNAYNPLIWLGIGLAENNQDDRAVGFEIELNTTWVEINPMSGIVEPESELPVSAIFRAGNWMPGTYDLVLVIESNAAGEDIELPLTMSISDEGLEPEHYEFSVTDIEHLFTINAVQLRGQRAAYGDEIGIFTPDDLCVGASRWFDQVTTVSAYGDDPETDEVDGFETGEEPAFKVYDISAGVEFDALFTRSSGDETFQAGGFTRGTLTVAGNVVEQVFNLPLGWSLISSYLILDRHDTEFIFADLVERGVLIMLKDGRGDFYRPDHHFDSIEEWRETQGYQIKLHQNDSFVLSGEMQDPYAPIDLVANWNLIAYFPDWEIPALVAFEELGDNLIIVKDGSGNFYVPEWDFTNMGGLRPGNGYFIKVREAAEFRYSMAEGVPAYSTALLQPNHLSPVVPTGNNMSLLVSSSGEYGGCDLTVVDASGHICGTAYLNENNPTGLAIWGDDPTTSEVEGPVGGDKLSFIVYREGVVVENVQFGLLSGEAVYRIDGFMVIEASGLEATVPTEFYFDGAYPNPFNERTMVSFGIAEPGEVCLSIYDLNGRLADVLISGQISAGHHAISWQPQGLASGLYLLRLETASHSRTVKVLLLQ